MTTATATRRLELLVVDDDPHYRALLQQELGDDGYSVIPACSGKEALELAKKMKPDMVILDVRMPGIDGLQTLGHMLAQYRNLAVILHTAYSMYKDDFRSWSADEYVQKSGDLTALKEKIRELSIKKGLGAVNDASA